MAMIWLNRTRPAGERQTRCLQGLLTALSTLAISLGSVDAGAADLLPAGVRVARVVHKFEDVWQFAAIYPLRAPRRLRAHHLELAVGAFSSPAETRPFLSLGPVWDFRSQTQALALELGFSATLLGGSTLAGRELGGNLHFTSSVALATRFGEDREYALSLRIQHTSNGGLNSPNPGLDAIALTFSIDKPNR
jgi:hypothetical protein